RSQGRQGRTVPAGRRPGSGRTAARRRGPHRRRGALRPRVPERRRPAELHRRGAAPGRLGPAPPARRGGERLGRRRARPTRGGAARNSPATPRPGGQGDRTSGRGEGRPGLEAGRGDPGRGGTGDPGCRRAAVRGSGHMEDANLNTTTPNLELAVEKVSKTRVKVTVRAGGEPMFADTLNV